MTEKEMKKLSLLAECGAIKEICVRLSLALEAPVHRDGKARHRGLAGSL